MEHIDWEDTKCDGVHIGEIGKGRGGMFYGRDLHGNIVDSTADRPAVWRTLRHKAYEAGLLTKVRKGIYRAAEGQRA
jgi:hypothetical protein